MNPPAILDKVDKIYMQRNIRIQKDIKTKENKANSGDTLKEMKYCKIE